MPELRWTLLILGVLFIVTLAVLELRRKRGARGRAPLQGVPGREGEPEGRVHREPTLTFDDLPQEAAVDAGRDSERRHAADDFSHQEFRVPEAAGGRERPPRVDPRLDPFATPPVVEMEPEAIDRRTEGLKLAPEAAVDAFSAPLPSRDDESDAADRADGEGDVAVRAARLDERDDADRSAWGEEDEHSESEVAERAHADRGESDEHELGEPLDLTPRRAEPHIPELAPAHPTVPLSENIAPPSEPIVDWPEEGARRIVALRLVSRSGERFLGRNVRLALLAEGFLLGKFDIFHKPGPDGRAVLSAASLTKPGTFHLNTMDAQRFGGLSLFAVLPGPLSPLATFDELLTTARALNDRLRGALQDERGEPLTPVRSASIRESLSATAVAAAPVVGPPPAADSQDASDAPPPAPQATETAEPRAETSPHEAGPA